jgi:5-bromo-4-chloroindolyl phosphate hydrolysis protein
MVQIQSTDLEKKNLEAHVDLCAERYKYLEQALAQTNADMQELKVMMQQLHELQIASNSKSLARIWQIGGGTIGTLLIIVGYLLTTYVLV